MQTAKGSELIDYNDSDLYDHYRVPIGIEAICDLLDNQKHLTTNSFSLLSLCCGTGTNEAQLLSNTQTLEAIKTLHCVDFSTTMLSGAQRRLSEFSEQLTLSFDALDVLEDTWPGAADSILCCQAIHHFDKGDTSFENISRFFEKAANYLDPGGRLILTFSTPLQMLEAQWYTAIRAKEKSNDPALIYGKEFPPLEIVLGHLDQAGFAVHTLQPLEGPYAPPEQFTDHTLLDDKTFQDGDSFFSLARDKGLLEPYLSEVHDMADRGVLDAHIAHAEKRRNEIGIAFLLSAEKM